AIHGDLGQGAREQALRAFRAGKVDVLVATDVAARGIDVENVTHVVNYQCPEDEKTYLHRIGRTARAGNTGVAVTFVDWDDIPRWGLINTTLDLGIPEPQETYSSSPHLYAHLDIPQGTTGTLPVAARTRAGLDAERVEDLGTTGRAGGPRAGGLRGGRGGRGSDGGRGSSERGRGGANGRGSSGRGRGGSGGRGRGRDEATPAGQDGARASGGPTTETSDGGRRRTRNRRRTRGGRPAADAG
ncbi:MAG: helicase-related protein, partial [Dermatophilaceae bacterium]